MGTCNKRSRPTEAAEIQTVAIMVKLIVSGMQLSKPVGEKTDTNNVEENSEDGGEIPAKPPRNEGNGRRNGQMAKEMREVEVTAGGMEGMD